jgi:SAM-dependent methyltransferase
MNIIINKLLSIPMIWNMSQSVIGSNAHKQQLYRSLFTSTGKLLDFGCANGNTFPAFVDFEYYGIDVDAKFVDYARNKFRNYPNAHWVTADIRDNPFEDNTFDYVLFASTGHHIPDDMLCKILKSLIGVVKKNGLIYLIDIVARPGKDNWWKELLIRYDQGQFTRTEIQYKDIISQFCSEVTIVSESIRKMRGNFFDLPDFYISVLKKNNCNY